MSNPTVTLNPASTADDGIVGGGSNTSWALARAAAGGAAFNAQNSSYMGYGSNNAGDANTYYIYRTFLGHFDLSGIPAGAQILSAILSVYSTATASYTLGGGTTANNSAVLVAGTQASPLTTADFGAVGSTELASNRIAYSTFASSGYKDFTLNAAGLAHLQAAIGGSAKFAVRSGYDFDNVTPANTGYSGGIAYFSDQTGTANDPKLVIVYSLDRAATDGFSFTDGPTLPSIDEADGDRQRWALDTITLTDSPLFYRRSTVEVEVFPEGANTYLNQSGVVGSTINVGDTTGFPSSGEAWLIDNTKSTQQQAVCTYTGKTGTSLTGCTWTSIIGRSTYADGSLNFDATVTAVSVPNAESHFPQIISLDPPGTVNPELVISVQQHAGHAALRGKLVFKRTTDGGKTWGSQETIVGSPANGSAWGMFGHTALRLKNGHIWVSWYEHKLDYTAGDSTLVVKQMQTISTDRMLTWSTPTQIPFNMGFSDDDGSAGFGSYLYTGAGSDATYGDILLPITGNPDGIQIHASGEPWRWETWLYKVNHIASTATKIAEVFKPSNTGNRAAGEGDICQTQTGGFIMHARVEPNDATDFLAAEERNRWQAVATSGYSTWAAPTKVISSFANAAVLTRLPGGTIIATGSPVRSSSPADAHPGQTGSVPSSDNGTTWTRAIKWEATNGTYSIYNGANLEVIIDDSSVQVNTVFTYSQERSNQAGARTMFRWYVDPIKRAADNFALTDTATRAAQSFTRAAADGFSFTDTAARQGAGLSKTAADGFAFTDTAGRSAITYTRTAADGFSFTDTTTRSVTPYTPPVGYQRMNTTSRLVSAGSATCRMVGPGDASSRVVTRTPLPA